MYEHPDFPMDEKKIGVKDGEHIPAKAMLQYLQAFVDETSIAQFLRLCTNVEVIRKTDSQWVIHCTPTPPGPSYIISTFKLIIATGTTNIPKFPFYQTSPSFTPKILHSKDFPAHYPDIVKPNKHTLVIGAGKSAYDIAFSCAKQPNATVTLLIRPDGSGPNWLVPSHVTPFRLWLEKLVFTRFVACMSPCPWAHTTGLEGWIRSFLHGTRLGRRVVRGFWYVLGEDAINLNRLREHKETRKLVPWRGAFEVANCLGIHNYSTNFFDLVREGRVRVVVDEVQGFEDGSEVQLKSGEILTVDAVVCATGWKAGCSIRFEPEELKEQLGLPTVRLTPKTPAVHLPPPPSLTTTLTPIRPNPQTPPPPKPSHLQNPPSSPNTPSSPATPLVQTTPIPLSAPPNPTKVHTNPTASTASSSPLLSYTPPPSPSPAHYTASVPSPSHTSNPSG